MEAKLSDDSKSLWSKVPEVTFFFWLIKVMGTTVGETAADFLSFNLKLGLPITSAIMSVILAAALVVQIREKKYVPWKYWLSVILISVVGTLITDNMVENLNIPLEATTAIFSVLLAATFVIWFINEKTLSIHSIFTMKRELFYWATILFTFALGTASGDLASEGLKLGYAVSAIAFAGIIGVVALCFYAFKMNSILAFWIAYVLTRPLGASCGDLLIQPTENGGLGISNWIVNAVFLVMIVLLVAYLTVRQKKHAQTPV